MDVDTNKVYHLLTRYRIFCIPFTALFTFWVVVIIYTLFRVVFWHIKLTGNVTQWLSTILMIPLGSTWLYYQIFFTRITISPDTIEYHSWMGYVQAKWDDIVRIGTYKSYVTRKVDGIYVKPANRWLLLQVQPGKEMFIPLGWFVKDWQTSDVGREIMLRAPQLVLPPKPRDI